MADYKQTQHQNTSSQNPQTRTNTAKTSPLPRPSRARLKAICGSRGPYLAVSLVVENKAAGAEDVQISIDQ